ncbi:hypothetical protein DFJ74DRAFT_760553 [Hyaloraphidium curvatum]|nr:hypothetical protein DFJ74DRAFT_760553 [Hyaloraphidium curvatum]
MQDAPSDHPSEVPKRPPADPVPGEQPEPKKPRSAEPDEVGKAEGEGWNGEGEGIAKGEGEEGTRGGPHEAPVHTSKDDGAMPAADGNDHAQYVKEPEKKTAEGTSGQASAETGVEKPPPSGAAADSRQEGVGAENESNKAVAQAGAAQGKEELAGMGPEKHDDGPSIEQRAHAAGQKREAPRGSSPAPAQSKQEAAPIKEDTAKTRPPADQDPGTACKDAAVAPAPEKHVTPQPEPAGAHDDGKEEGARVEDLRKASEPPRDERTAEPKHPEAAPAPLGRAPSAEPPQERVPASEANPAEHGEHAEHASHPIEHRAGAPAEDAAAIAGRSTPLPPSSDPPAHPSDQSEHTADPSLSERVEPVKPAPEPAEKPSFAELGGSIDAQLGLPWPKTPTLAEGGPLKEEGEAPMDMD